MKVLSIDPGGTTGWKIVTFDSFQEPGNVKWRHGHIGPHKHHMGLRDFLSAEETGDLIIILEGFDNRGNPAAVLVALEYIGVVQLWCKQNSVECIVQQPAQKEWATNKKLKACGIYVPGMKHSNDAARHLLVWLVCKMYFKPMLKLLKENL